MGKTKRPARSLSIILICLMILISCSLSQSFLLSHSRVLSSKLPRLSLLQPIALFSSEIPQTTGTSNFSRALEIQDELQKYYDQFPHIKKHQWSLLQRYCSYLTEWNEKINLISRKDIQYFVPKHLIPALAVSLACDLNHSEVIDVGTGGGLPGLPLAIVYPHASFTLLDSSQKKMKVVESIAEELNLRNVKCITKRAEEYKKPIHDFIIGRAVSELPNFLSYSSHLLRTKAQKRRGSARKQAEREEIVDKELVAWKSLSEGLIYIKGGEVQPEIDAAGIRSFQQLSLTRLIPSMETDKYLLYVPGEEVRSFHVRDQKRQKKEREERTQAYLERKQAFVSSEPTGPELDLFEPTETNPSEPSETKEQQERPRPRKDQKTIDRRPAENEEQRRRSVISRVDSREDVDSDAISSETEEAPKKRVPFRNFQTRPSLSNSRDQTEKDIPRNNSPRSSLTRFPEEKTRSAPLGGSRERSPQETTNQTPMDSTELGKMASVSLDDFFGMRIKERRAARQQAKKSADRVE